MVRDQGRAAPLQLRLRIAARHRPPRCRSDRCSRAGARRAAAGELPLAIVYAMLPLIIYNSMLIYAFVYAYGSMVVNGIVSSDHGFWRARPAAAQRSAGAAT